MHSGAPFSNLKRILPLIGFLILSGITLALWQNQKDLRHQLLVHHLETSVEQLKIRIEGMMGARLASLEMIAARWVERQPPDFSRERFLGFSRAISEHYPGFAEIYWIDPEGVVQWTFPENDHAVAPGQDFRNHPDPGTRQAFASAGLSERVVLSPCVVLRQGGMGFHVFLALTHEGRLQGYLAGVFQVERVMGMSLSNAMLDDFTVELHESGRPIYLHSTGGHVNSAPDPVRATRDIRIEGRTWRISVQPNAGLSSPVHGSNVGFLLFGFALSATLSLIWLFLLRRMELYKEARDRAVREVNERERAENALRENEKRLNDLLAELADRNAELESFTYAVSHDLKTPIITIGGFIRALREDLGDGLPESAAKYIAYISDAARGMELLINDLLDLSRIGRLPEAKMEFSLADPVRDALAILQPQIEARHVTVNFRKDLPVVWGERSRLGQVMVNLLSNALKYMGDNHPSPQVEVGWEARDGETLFYVRDNGMGIEERYFERIFQVFERLPDAEKAGEGTGMGLTIVKKIIECHGGRIWVESEKNRGATFYFTLAPRDRH